jgi:hypothetical protein
MGHVIPILEWIAGLGLVAAIVVQIFQNRYRAIEAKSWPTAQATIQSGGVEPVNSGERSAVILPCFAFSYVVNGEYYSGRFSLWGCDGRSATLLHEMIERKIPIRYNPAKPEDFEFQDRMIEGCGVQRVPD